MKLKPAQHLSINNSCTAVDLNLTNSVITSRSQTDQHGLYKAFFLYFIKEKPDE
jgi:hypothetical protein